MNEPLWISEEIVRVIHQDQIQQHGVGQFYFFSYLRNAAFRVL